MTELRCGIFTTAKWVVRITGDAITEEPENVSRRVSWAPDGPVRVIGVDLTWRLDGRTVHGRGAPAWWPCPRVELDLYYVDADGGWISPDVDNDYWIEREIVDFTDRFAPGWVRRLIETRASGPTGDPVRLPAAVLPQGPVCVHDECPIHGGDR